MSHMKRRINLKFSITETANVYFITLENFYFINFRSTIDYGVRFTETWKCLLLIGFECGMICFLEEMNGKIFKIWRY